MTGPDSIIRFVLLNTQESGNIGSVCRVLSNFGFAPSDLLLVNPQCDPLSDAARARAGNAQHWLDQLEIRAELQPLPTNVVRIAGTTSKSTVFLHQVTQTPEPFFSNLPGPLEGQTYILFGGEHHGLHPQELLLCDSILSIPTSESYEALNLSMAVGIVAFAFRQWSTPLQKELRPKQGRNHRLKAAREPTPSALFEKLFERVLNVATVTGFLNSQHPWKLQWALRRVFRRMNLTRQESQWTLGLVTQIQIHLARLKEAQSTPLDPNREHHEVGP